MHTAPAASKFDRVFQMQHFMKEDVLDSIAWHARAVEDAADDDGVMRGIVMAEAGAGVVAAPGELWTSHESVKETAVEVVEDLLQMVLMAAGGTNVFASPHLPDKACLSGNVVAGNVAAIARAVGAINRLAIKLGQ